MQRYAFAYHLYIEWIASLSSEAFVLSIQQVSTQTSLNPISLAVLQNWASLFDRAAYRLLLPETS